MKRDLCLRCSRPTPVCYCRDLQPVAAPLRLALLQPARERKHPLNTGRIVALGIDNCDIFEGEDFSTNRAFLQLLQDYQGRTWLLYPGEQALTPEQLPGGQMNKPTAPEEGLLVVLDATWKKSRKMLYLCPELAALPRVALSETMISSYRLRKVPGAGYLSTVEAVTALLARTGHPPEACAQMLAAFDAMISAQILAMGDRVWQNNYSHRR